MGQLTFFVSEHAKHLSTRSCRTLFISLAFHPECPQQDLFFTLRLRGRKHFLDRHHNFDCTAGPDLLRKRLLERAEGGESSAFLRREKGTSVQALAGRAEFLAVGARLCALGGAFADSDVVDGRGSSGRAVEKGGGGEGRGGEGEQGEGGGPEAFAGGSGAGRARGEGEGRGDSDSTGEDGRGGGSEETCGDVGGGEGGAEKGIEEDELRGRGFLSQLEGGN